MNHSEICQACYRDRLESFNKVSISWVKKNAFDLLAKYLIVLANLIGPKDTEFKGYVFVDEIKNNSMRNNLYATIDVFEKNGQDFRILPFYYRGSKSLKLGYVWPIRELLYTFLRSIPIIVMASIGKDQTFRIISLLERRMSILMTKCGCPKEIYLMTDHHFFSSIIAMKCPEKCAVIQHGLVMGQSLYYPIRASRFLAWGEHSRELQHYDPAVEIVGTYKFNGIKGATISNHFNNVIFCINSLDDEVVKGKIEVLSSLSTEIGYKLIVKCHPGSFYSADKWKELFRDKSIDFYKEELIQDLEFDLAISENSTVILDLISMNKPFILYDTINGYFSDYSEIIPHADSRDGLLKIMKTIDDIDFSKINCCLREKELNQGNCVLYEHRKV